MVGIKFRGVVLVRFKQEQVFGRSMKSKAIDHSVEKFVQSWLWRDKGSLQLRELSTAGTGVSTWQRSSVQIMLYKGSSTISLPWREYKPTMSSCVFEEGLREQRRKITQVLGKNTLELQYWGSAEFEPRVHRRRSQALLSDTWRQRSHQTQGHMYAHNSYKTD